MIYKIFIFTRHNVSFHIGDSKENVVNNRQKICKKLKIDKNHLISLKQIHSDKIIYVDCPQTKEIYGFDGIITDKKGLFLMIKIADCQAVCIYDPVKEVIANIHAGWKGSAQNIVGKTIRKMKEKFGCEAENLHVGISPSLGPCHSKFSDPYNELPKKLHKYIQQNNHVDFWQATIDQCINEGVAEKNIEKPEICTACHPEKYFSYRADKGETGRFAVIIGMT